MKMSFAIIIGGALFIFIAVVMVAVFIPGWVWTPPQTLAAHVYTDQELLGRKVFYSNGCDYCHTQYVRYYDADATGPISQGGSYIFDQPLTLGSERTGPDLSYIGRKRDLQWEIDHLKDPRKYSPMSIMPRWAFLPQHELEAVAAYLFNLGNRVAAEYMVQPPVDYAHLTTPIDIPEVTPDPAGNSQGWDNWKAASLQDGKIIYIDRCQTCHGVAGNGLGTYAGTKVVTPADFSQNPIRNMPDDQWFWHVSEGVQGSVMPPWRESLTETQRWQVIRYIQQQFAQPVERDPDEGDPPPEYANLTNPLPQTIDTLEQGKAIWTRECFICHGDSGQGEGLYGKLVKPAPADFNNPDAYGTMADPSYTDSDYFWRISEGLPWAAMPVWKVKYSEADRWSLVYYIRVNYTQTLTRPPDAGDPVYPEIYLSQKAPVDKTANDMDVGDSSQLVYRAPDPDLGKTVFATYCAECHNFTGLGTGWAGAYLDVPPANFSDPDVQEKTEGDLFSRISLGLPNTAMLKWGEWLPEQDRWDALSFMQKYVIAPVGTGQVVIQPSVFTTSGGKIQTLFFSLSQGNWTDEGGVLDPAHGGDLYTQYCATCHGDKGGGILPKDAPAALVYPAPFPENLPQSYVYQQIWSGIPNTIMPTFRTLLQPADVWDLVVYLVGEQK